MPKAAKKEVNQRDLIMDLIENDNILLIILDACRYDYFRDLNTIEGNLDMVISPESSTGEWLVETWTDYYNIAYVSANPNIATNFRNSVGWLSNAHFQYIEDVWKWGWQEIEEIPTVPAEEVVKGVDKVMKKGHSRIVAHFMQPHPPYIGEKKLGINTFNRCRNSALGKSPGRDFLISPVGNSELVELVKMAYASNLSYVLEEGVKPLLKYTDFEIVVTADHGEILGERGEFGHGGGKATPELLQVPWFLPELK